MSVSIIFYHACKDIWSHFNAGVVSLSSKELNGLPHCGFVGILIFFRLVCAAFVIFWITVSAVPLNEFCDISAIVPAYSISTFQKVQAYRLASGYGLFRVMSGVGKLSPKYNGNEWGSLGQKAVIV